jgi:pilus assembly protein CpaD
MNSNPHTASNRRVIAIGTRLLLIGSIASFVAGCNTFRDTAPTSFLVESDYRARHPIGIKEGKKTLAVFVGAGRGGLSATQRAEVLAFAQNWKRDATGGITIDRPIGGPNERAARDTLKEVLSIITLAGIPEHGIGIRPYESNGDTIAPLRLKYSQLAAEAGPCGLWPDDLGASYDLKHYENQHYHNFGCAQQRNLASMVANPADLVQPRAETPIYTAKRTFGMDKWRKGESPSTTYPDTQKGAISDLGK